ncbi:ABC transporter ATP-binding protein [Microvirga subterranea]|nr:ABC transporter ATP-binding protein [Microvirga subterranea]
MGVISEPVTAPPTLAVRDLNVSFRSLGGEVRIVRDISFEIPRGEVFAIIGESGSGKSTTAQAIMGLQPKGATVRGQILLGKDDIQAMAPRARRRLNGQRVSLISQDALSALNPCTTVGYQIAEVLMVHRGVAKQEAMARAVELLSLTGIPAPSERVNHYPHQFSGGMRQRALIAIALALEPELLIADEPTTALDATIKAQILTLLASLRERFGMSILLITHDMGAVARLADRVLVMYAGQAMEVGDVASVFARPEHPYTRALLESMPRLDKHGALLEAIPGTPPSPSEVAHGCPFQPRCAFAGDICREQMPPAVERSNGGHVACHFALREMNYA